MGRHLREALPAGVQETRAKFDAWRRNRNPGVSHPAELWTEAVEWARRYGINPVSAALGLSYTDLQKRMGQAHRGVLHLPKALEPAFVELPIASGARMHAPGEGSGCQAGVPGGPVVEVVSPDGARMVMCWPSGAAVDVGNLVVSFLGRRQ